MMNRITVFSTLAVSLCLSAAGCGVPAVMSESTDQVADTTAFRAQAVALDLDVDGDSVLDLSPDNCPLIPNDQSDVDADGFGDLCDTQPAMPNSYGLPAARGEDAVDAFAEQVKVYQGMLQIDSDAVYVTMTRVCRRIDSGPFAIDAENLKAGLMAHDADRSQYDRYGGYAPEGAVDLLAVVKPDLNVSYQRLVFSLGERAAQYNGQGGTGAGSGKDVLFWDDSNDDGVADAGETRFGHAHWSPGARMDYAGLLVNYGSYGTYGGYSTDESPSSPPLCDEHISSPLVFDLGHDGFAPFSAPEVLFDLDADGTSDLVGWPTGANDALLALDLNGDGVVNDGGELFGNHTLTSTGELAANGFEALAQHDADGNGRIDSADPVFANLLLWQDSNGDGLSQLDELSDAVAHGIEAINLAYMSAHEVDTHGNETQQRSAYWYIDADGTRQMDIVIDVWFKTSHGPTR